MANLIEQHSKSENQPTNESVAQPQINVLLVDDHAIMRGGLRKLLEIEPDIQVIAEAATGKQALELVVTAQPHVVVLDINLPALNGLEVTIKLKAERRNCAVVLLTAYDEPEQQLHAMRVGASAYCPKVIEPQRLIEIIRLAAAGKYVIGTQVYDARGVQEWINAQVRALPGPNFAESEERFTPLSPREMEILRGVARGLGNKAIAQELGITHQTVRNHMTSILHKLGVEGRTHAAIYALKRGWVRAEEYRPPVED